MKKITLLLFLTISPFLHAQWSTLIADGTFDTAVIRGNSIPYSNSSWQSAYNNTFVSTVNNECRFLNGKNPILRQRFLVAANTAYKIQFQCFVKTSTAPNKHVDMYITEGTNTTELTGISIISDGQMFGNKFRLPISDIDEDNPGNNYTYEFLFSSGTNTDVMININIANPSQDYFLDNFAMVEDTPLSLKKESSTAFSYSPNPARTHINLSAKTAIKSAELLNSIGKKIMSKDIQSNNGVLNIAHLQSGVYILKVFLEDTIVSRKILIE
jgi:hypothetical protein